MKHKSSFVIVYWWLLILLLCGLFLMAFADKEERMSLSENRMLSGFPELSGESLASGEFFLGIESYLSDGVWGRDQIVGVSDSVLGLFCANTAEEADLLSNAAMESALQSVAGTPAAEADSQETAQTDSQQPSAEQPEVPASGEDVPEQAESAENLTGYGMWRIQPNGDYVAQTKATEEDIQRVARMLNSFKETLPEDGSVFYTNVPLASVALRTRDTCAGWYDNLDVGLGQYIDEGIHILNAPALLTEPLWNGENLFYASDHHWTPRGAIRIANACIRLLGYPAVPFEEYEYTHHTFSMAAKNASDDLELLHPLQEVSGYNMLRGKEDSSRSLINYHSPTYHAFLDGDSSNFTKYVTGFSTGRKALVVGDSFTNAMTPYLMPYYDEVYKVDARYYKPMPNGGTMAEMIDHYGVDDVYIILCYQNGVTAEISKSILETALNG